MAQNIKRTSALLAGAGTALYVYSPFLEFEADQTQPPDAPLVVSVMSTATGDTGEFVAYDAILDETIDVRPVVRSLAPSKVHKE